MYVHSPLETNAQLSKACKPAMGSLHDPAVLTQLLAALNASSCNTAEDSSLLEVCPAARVVIALVCMKFVGPPARAALQALDCRNGIHTRFKQHGVMPVGSTDKDDQRNAPGIYDEMSFGA